MYIQASTSLTSSPIENGKERGQLSNLKNFIWSAQVHTRRQALLELIRLFRVSDNQRVQVPGAPDLELGLGAGFLYPNR